MTVPSLWGLQSGRTVTWGLVAVDQKVVRLLRAEQDPKAQPQAAERILEGPEDADPVRSSHHPCLFHPHPTLYGGLFLLVCFISRKTALCCLFPPISRCRLIVEPLHWPFQKLQLWPVLYQQNFSWKPLSTCGFSPFPLASLQWFCSQVGCRGAMSSKVCSPYVLLLQKKGPGREGGKSSHSAPLGGGNARGIHTLSREDPQEEFTPGPSVEFMLCLEFQGPLLGLDESPEHWRIPKDPSPSLSPLPVWPLARLLQNQLLGGRFLMNSFLG